MFSKPLQSAKSVLTKDLNFRRIVVNSGWLLGSNTISLVLNFGLSVIMTRALGAENYGILILMMNYIITIDQLVDSRVWEAVIKFIPQYIESGQLKRATATLKLFYLIEVCSALLQLAIIWATAAFAAATFVKNPEMASLIRFYGLYVIIDFSTETSSALLRLHNRFKWLSYQDIAQAVLKVVGALIVWLLGGSIELMIVSMLLTSLLGVIIMQVMTYQVAREMKLVSWLSSPISLLKGEWRTIFSFLFFTNLNASSRLVQQRVDVLLLGWLSTPVSAGLYDIGKRLATQILTFFGPINVAVYPETSRLIAQGQYSQLIALLKKLTLSITVVVLPLCLVLMFVYPVIIPLVFGEDYTSAVPLTQVMIWFLPFWVTLIWLPGFLLALGRVRLLTAITWLSTAFYVLVLFVAIPAWGGMGAAVAMLSRNISWFVLAVAALLHLHRIDWRTSHRLKMEKSLQKADPQVQAAK
jgi:O-antigen/teichoic acid export membrane protein